MIETKNEVVRNALMAKACNARFKVGDYVHIKGAGNDSLVYEIDKVETGTDGKPAYHVKKFPFAWFSEREVFSNSAVAANAFYKTEEEAEYRAKTFIDAALSRIKGDIDGEIKTVSDCIKLFKGAPMSD